MVPKPYCNFDIGASIARTLRDVICDHGDNTISNNRSDVMIFGSEDFKLSANRTCWEEHVISRLSMYRIILVFFTLIVGPIVSLSIQKTKYLQIFTAVLRWLAFTFMICITTKMLITSGPKGHPVAVNVYGSPSLFGACVYSFMCHHSLPSLLAPLRNKEKVIQILSFDYILICAFYIVLAMTGIFAFEHVDELYTLNFLPYNVKYEDFLTGLLIVINYFLSLFPVFALSTSYPVIAITLKNNLKILFLDMTQYDSYHIITRSIFPLLAIIPPFCVTYFTESLSTLVAFTGTYAGAGIQYIIPVCLVYFSRSTCSELLGCGIVNQYQSPFKSKIWLGLVILWSIICVSLVTINLLG
ncbi:transmembrane protein 104 homolog isoform X2 [Drosophila busckii]|uniref:transmembrane protein 104 homolog isoform X2 n=1 Tax=Drosophila busckii TaxID=30019 RepID=UPI00083F1AB8|nr:transmembrane protein 104 homolog isoform X2 [Drosophila busckii]